MPAASIEDFDVPIICRSCDGNFTVAYRFLSPGIYLRCPYCGAPFCPTQRMYLTIGQRLDRYADEVNEEIDRHNAVIAAEQDEFEGRAADLRAAAERDVRTTMNEMTEPPKKSLFG